MTKTEISSPFELMSQSFTLFMERLPKLLLLLLVYLAVLIPLVVLAGLSGVGLMFMKMKSLPILIILIGFMLYASSVCLLAYVALLADKNVTLGQALEFGRSKAILCCMLLLVQGCFIWIGERFFYAIALVLQVYTLFSIYVFAYESVGPFEAITRSFGYVKGRFFDILLVAGIPWLAGALAALVPGLFGSLLGLCVLPFVAAIWFLLYQEIRQLNAQGIAPPTAISLPKVFIGILIIASLTALKLHTDKFKKMPREKTNYSRRTSRAPVAALPHPVAPAMPTAAVVVQSTAVPQAKAKEPEPVYTPKKAPKRKQGYISIKKGK